MTHCRLADFLGACLSFLNGLERLPHPHMSFVCVAGLDVPLSAHSWPQNATFWHLGHGHCATPPVKQQACHHIIWETPSNQ